MSKDMIETIADNLIGDHVALMTENKQLRDRIEEIERDRDALLADNARLRGVLEVLAKLGNGDKYGNSDGNRIAQRELAGAPEQSLARIRNQVREDIAIMLETHGWLLQAAYEVRNMKEPE